MAIYQRRSLAAGSTVAYFVEVGGAEVSEADAHERDDGEVGAGRVELGERGVRLENVLQPAGLDAVVAHRRRQHGRVVDAADEQRRARGDVDGARHPVDADHQVQHVLEVPATTTPPRHSPQWRRQDPVRGDGHATT